jgi:hypothetical protein
MVLENSLLQQVKLHPVWPGPFAGKRYSYTTLLSKGKKIKPISGNLSQTDIDFSDTRLSEAQAARCCTLRY